MCSAKMPSLTAARISGSLCSRDLILKLLHINSSIPSKLSCEIIFWCTKLPISQFFDEFSNAEKCFLHMTVTVLFLVSPPTADGSHDFSLFLMLCQNFLGDLCTLDSPFSEDPLALEKSNPQQCKSRCAMGSTATGQVGYFVIKNDQ